MALFGRDYDRDYGYRGNPRDRGYDRGFRPGWNDAGRDDPYLGMTRDDRGYGMYGSNRGFRGWGDNRDFGPSGYDRGYKSRWQTDHGDPFGDRTSRTPMRLTRGEYHPGYDQGYRGSERGHAGYGRDYYEANPMSYDPYSPRSNREAPRGSGNPRPRGPGRGYDTGWF